MSTGLGKRNNPLESDSEDDSDDDSSPTKRSRSSAAAERQAIVGKSHRTKTMRAIEFFKETDYLFVTDKNNRGILWDINEDVDPLLRSIIDGRKGDELLMLNTVVLVEEEWDEFFQRCHSQKKQTPGKQTVASHIKIYSVYDGQHRLVFLSLLIAAVLKVLKEHKQNTQELLVGWIYPQTFRRWRTTRIGNSRQEGELLEQILSQHCDFQIPSEEERNSLSASGQCLLDMYTRILETLRTEAGNATDGVEYLDEIIEYVCRNVIVTQSIPPTAELATSMLVSQTEGKPLEPVDVLRLHINNKIQPKRDDRDKIANLFSSLDERVPRKVMETACLHLAQAHEMPEVMVSKHNVAAKIKLAKQYVSKYFYYYPKTKVEHFVEREIVPACLALHRLEQDDLNLSPTKDTIYASLKFLQYASKHVTCGKEIEMVVMKFLTWYDESNEKNDNDERSKTQDLIKVWVKEFDAVALWMLVSKPDHNKRRKLCYSVLRRTSWVLEDLSRRTDVTFLTEEQKAETLRKLRKLSIDPSSHTDKALVRAILERLERHALMRESGSVDDDPMLASRTSAQAIQAIDKDSALDWHKRLGNFALGLGSGNRKQPPLLNERFGSSTFTLTQGLSNITTWDHSTFINRHNELLRMSNEAWSLGCLQYV